MAQFKESEHPRDKEGKFKEKGASDKYNKLVDKYSDTPGEDKRNLKTNHSGAKSGALNPDSEKDKDKADKHAKQMYKQIIARKFDVYKISKLTGIEIEKLNKIKQYVFNNKEFTPDYDQAVTWQRLSEGKPIKADYIFLKHELLEMKYREKGYNYNLAHDLAEQKYNYSKAIRNWRYGNNKEKRNNGK